MVESEVVSQGIKECVSQGITLWDFIKLAAGPFIGASLAFLSNDVLHRRRKKQDEIAMIYGAWFAIAAMFDDFHNYRYFLRKYAAEMDARYRQRWPDDPAPLWAFSRPLLFEFRESGLPDLAALNFLLNNREGQQAYQALQLLERSYRSLALTHRKQNEAAVELQSKLRSGAHKTWADVAAGIEQPVVASAGDFVFGQFVSILNDERYYAAARDLLKVAAEMKFRKHINLVEFETRKGFDEGSLAPVPPSILAAIQVRTE